MRKSYRVKKEAEFQTFLRRVNHVRTANLSFTCLKSRARFIFGSASQLGKRLGMPLHETGSNAGFGKH